MCHTCFVHELFDHRRAVRMYEQAFVKQVSAVHRAQYNHDFLKPRKEFVRTAASAALYASAVEELQDMRARLVAVRREQNDARMRYVAWEELFVKEYGAMTLDVVKYLINPSPTVPSRCLPPSVPGPSLPPLIRGSSPSPSLLGSPLCQPPRPKPANPHPPSEFGSGTYTSVFGSSTTYVSGSSAAYFPGRR